MNKIPSNNPEARLKKELDKALQENSELKSRLSDAEETINCIREGKVDAIIVNGKDGDKIFSLVSAETPYRIILEEINEGAVTINRKGIILYNNPRFARIVSASPEKIPGSEFSGFISENDRPEFRKFIKTCLNKRAREVFKADIRGKVKYLQLSCVSLPPDIEGDLCIIVSDVTELRNYQDHLESMVDERTSELAEVNNRLSIAFEKLKGAKKLINQREQLWSSTLKSIGDAVIITDNSGYITFLNHVAEALTGWKIREARHKDITRIFRIINGKTRHEDENPVIKVLRTAGSSGITNNTLLISKDGKEIYIDYYVSSVANEKGRISGTVIIFRDITEKRKLQEIIKESEARLNIILRNSRDVVVQFNLKEKKYEYVSPSIREITGYMPDEFIAMDQHEALAMVHPDDLPELLAAEAIAEKTGSSNAEYRQLTKSGTYLWVSNLMSVSADSNGKKLFRFSNIRDISHRKRFESKLKEYNETLEQTVRSRSAEILAERQRLYDVLETLPVYVILLDKDYRVPFENKFFRERFGESRGRRCYEYLFDRTAECDGCETFKVMKTKAPHHWEWTGPDNRNYDIYDYPFYEADGSMLILEMGIDITLQKRAQNALMEANVYHRNLIETSLDPLVTISPDGKITDVNSATIKATGFSREKLIGTDFSDYFTEPEKARKGYMQIYARGLITDYPLTIRHRKGRLTDVLYNASVYKDKNGNVQGIFAAARDITERKKAEVAIQTERKRFFDVLETLPVMLCLLTPDYHVAFANRAFRKKFGASKGRPCYEYCHGKKEPCDFCESFRSLETGKPHRYEMTTPEGAIIDVYNFPFTDVDGSSLILEMDIDITEQKLAGEKLLKQQEHLQILNEDLLKSNKELESFAYITSHDLQEPLRMVTSYTQLLAMKYKDKLDENAKDYINFAVDGARRMYDLINGLLQYSRITRVEATKSHVDLNKIIKAVKANMALVIEERKVKISTRKLPVISADYNQMIQLFQNLISNGIKFSTGEPCITISSKTRKDHYYFAVKDNGIGIESIYFDKIFEIFKRLKSRDEYEGTGIGLSICKRIIENHNGRIWVESEPGKGSVFHFTIPKKE